MVRRLSFTAATVAVLYGSWQIAGATYAAGYGWATHAATAFCVATAIGLPVAIVTGVVMEHRRQGRMFPAPKPVAPAAPVPVIHAVITTVPAVTR